jgi:hypothetical protein
MMEAAPAAALVVIQSDLLLELLEGALNGLIANDKFCWLRTLRLRLSWPRARHWLKRPMPPHLSAQAIPYGAEHAAAADLAHPAHRRADGDRAAALGPGLPAPPAVGDDAASSGANRDAGAPDPAGDVSCE